MLLVFFIFICELKVITAPDSCSSNDFLEYPCLLGKLRLFDSNFNEIHCGGKVQDALTLSQQPTLIFDEAEEVLDCLKRKFHSLLNYLIF